MMTQLETFKGIITERNKPVNEERLSFFWEAYEKESITPPVNLMALAGRLRIEVYLSGSMADEESGVIRYESSSQKYKVYVNEKHSAKRKRFTLAHEIAHFVCDQDYLEQNGEIVESKKYARQDAFLNRASGLASNSDMVWRDIRANKFAAELLMPSCSFIEMWKKYETIEELAEKFNVSLHAAKVRTETLLGQIVEQ
jgi:Zn-dependent peptidase ImmA (M78 family)